MWQNLDRLASTLGTAGLLLLYSGLIAAKAVGKFLVATITSVLVFAGLLLVLAIVKVAVWGRELRMKVRDIAR